MVFSLARTVVAILALTATGPPPAAGNPAVVRTDAGRVEGTVHDGYRTFQGVPYAAAPTGDLRWRAPQPVAPWRGVRPATAPGPACAQNALGSGGTPTGAEDCLYLNVTTPARRRERLPVLVWLHGGSFQTGSGDMYGARRLATQGDIVVVTVNYRLGVFGYFGLPGLAGSGTFGLQDQQAALRWVRRNAAAFGGDPGNITLAGQSAGGESTCAHLGSPGAAGLFDKAIIQSGSCLTSWPDGLFLPGIEAGSSWEPVTKVTHAGVDLAADVGCPPGRGRLACLRGQPQDELLRLTQGAGLDAFAAPAYGTALLPLHPAEALRRGAFRRVPVLSGHTREEHRSLVQFAGPVDYDTVLRTAFGAQAARVAAVYPVEAYASPALAWAAVATDRIWACTTLAGNRLLAAHTPVYAYEFAEAEGSPWGAYHGSELPYLFEVTGLPGQPQPALTDRMIASWSRFAATGQPGWPAMPHAEVLAAGVQGPVDVGAEHHCAFWATLP